MENKKLNEQESLALITQMIQNSKKGLVVGSGNSLDVYKRQYNRSGRTVDESCAWLVRV